MSAGFEFEVSLPATSANLGPAFDAAALALNLYVRVRARRADVWSLTAVGVDAAICGKLDSNLLVRTYQDALAAAGRHAPALHLEIDNDIPIGKGCGSSAAARMAALKLANHFGELGWSQEQVCVEAGRLEGHWDNVAACWLGGLALAQRAPSGGVNLISVPVVGEWPFLLVVPPAPLATEEARRVLPAEYSRADVVANIQNAMLLTAAFSQTRKDLLQTALHDRIHEPYRAKLCPLLPVLQPLAGTGPIFGITLSGAGPSILVFLRDPQGRVTARHQIEVAIRTARLQADILNTSLVPSAPA